jgi:hypothetical protein
MCQAGSFNSLFMVKESQIFVIQNSGGRSSAFMTEHLLRQQPYRDNSVILFQNTGRENDKTLDFLHNCEIRWQQLYGHSITWLEYNPECPKNFQVVSYETAHRGDDKSKKSPFEKMTERYKALPNRVERICTRVLKIRTASNYLKSLGHRKWISLVGIRWDEPERYKKMPKPREGYTVEYPMVTWGTTHGYVLYFWKTMDFDLGLDSSQSNCDLCFLKGIGKLKRLIRSNPESAEWWIEMEQKKGATFRKDMSYEEIVASINNSPEFEFRDDYECDTSCFCNID